MKSTWKGTLIYNFFGSGVLLWVTWNTNIILLRLKQKGGSTPLIDPRVTLIMLGQVNDTFYKGPMQSMFKVVTLYTTGYKNV